MGNSTEGPWNTKHRAVVWSCSPTAQLRCRENRHSNWHVLLDLQGSTTYNRQDTESAKMPLTENWRLRVHLSTEMPLSHKAERKSDTASSLDAPRNDHTANAAQSGQDRHPETPCTEGPCVHTDELTYKMETEPQTEKIKSRPRGSWEGR